MTPPKPSPQTQPTTKSTVTYKHAARFYGQSAKHAADTPRQIEARALLKAARFLQDIQMRWETVTQGEIEAGLKINRHVWLAFFEQAAGKDEPQKYSLSNNITTLASFVFKRSLEILTRPDAQKLTALITINREVAAGLMAVKV